MTDEPEWDVVLASGEKHHRVTTTQAVRLLLNQQNGDYDSDERLWYCADRLSNPNLAEMLVNGHKVIRSY